MSVYRECLNPLLPYVPGKPIEAVQQMYGLDRVVKLASNENPLGCSPDVPEAVLRTFSQNALYPDGYCARLRGAVSRFYQIPENQLVFGCGTDEVIAMLGKVFVNPGDECITAAVTFSQYAASVESMGGVMVYAPMQNHAYDLDAILACVTEKTKLIFIANPNNPTGTVFDAQKQAAFMAQVPSKVTVVFDEAYAEYVADSAYPDTWQTLKQYSNVILLKTFSKIYGLASLRVGFGAMNPETASQMEKIRCPFNVTAQGQAAALAALADRDFVRRSFLENRRVMAQMEEAFKRIGLDFIPSQANFIMVDIKRDSFEVFNALMAKGYITRPGAAFGMDQFLRVTVGTEEQIEGFLRAFNQVLEEIAPCIPS